MASLYVDPENYPERPEDEDDEIEDLDFEAFPGGPASLGPAPELHGIPAVGWSDRVTEYVTWTCDCKATAKTGIPPRHVWRPISATTYDYPPTPFGVLIISREEKAPEQRHGPIKRDELGRPIVPEAAPAAPLTFTPCPTWRTVVRTSVPRRRDWRKLGVMPSEDEQARQTTPATAPDKPAGRVGPMIAAAPSELGRSAKQLMSYAKLPVLKATGRLRDGGEMVVQHRLVGKDGQWVAYFTDDGFTRATLGGQPVNFNALRSHVKAPPGAAGVSRDDSSSPRQDRFDLPG